MDIYATGMSILHLLSGCQPYGELDSDSFVLDAFSVSYELQSLVAVVSVAQMACPGGSGKGLLTGN